MTLCLLFSWSSELCSLHHWRWKCYFNWCVKIPGQGLCRYVFNTLGSFSMPASDVTLSLFARVYMYWQAAIIACQSHGSLLQAPITQKRKVNCNDAGLPVTWLLLFVFALTKDKAEYSVEVTAVARGRRRIGHWLCGNSLPAVSWHFFSNKTKPNKTCSCECCPPLIWNKLSPSFNL